MFCPKCGKKEVVDVFCKDCLKEEKPLIENFKPFEVRVCTASHRIFYKGKWQDSDDPEKKLAELMQGHLVPANDTEIKEILIAPIPIAFKDGLKQEDEAIIRVVGRASKKAEFYTEEYIFPYIIENTLSPKFRKHDQYFEGTLQVRNEHDEARDFLKGFIAEHGASVAKTTDHKNGTDYYLSSKAVIERAALELQHHFGGLIKTSAHLFGRDKQRSKDVYRVTALIQLPEFSVGEVVKSDKDVLLVLEMAKRIRFYSLNRGRVIYHEYKDFQWERLPIHETSVAATRPKLTVLHPETFQETLVKNCKTGPHEPGEEVRAVIDGRYLYLVEKI